MSNKPTYEELEFKVKELEKDVVEHRQSEASSAKSRESLELALKGAELGMWDWDLVKDSFILDTKSERLLGCIPSGCEDWYRHIHPDDLKEVKENDESVLKGQSEIINYDYRIITGTGEIRWFHAWGRVVEWYNDGKPKRATGTMKDVTEQKMIEKQLLESERNLKRAQRVSKIGNWYYDWISETEVWSDECFKLFGLNKDDYPDNVVPESLSFSLYANPEETDELSTSLAEKHDTYELEYATVPINGQVKTIHSYCEVEKDNKGNILKVFGTDHDITEYKNAEEGLRSALGGIIDAMAYTVEVRDPYTAGHQKRVSHLARLIATEMEMSDFQIDSIRLAASIHDIGKTAVPAEILSKPRELIHPEFELIKIHTTIGYEILKNIDFPWPISKIVYQHHEKINGSGYPLGLRNDDIMLEAQILCVADIVEAMTNHRPYRPALGMETAINEILEQKGKTLNSEVCESCIRVLKNKNFKWSFEA